MHHAEHSTRRARGEAALRNARETVPKRRLAFVRTFFTKRETTFLGRASVLEPVSEDDRLSSAPRASLALTGWIVNWIGGSKQGAIERGERRGG